VATIERIKTLATPVGMERAEAGLYPRFRGRSHQIALPIAAIGVVALIMKAPTNVGRIAAAIYGVSLVGLFTSSSLYNRMIGTERFRPWMRWFDHSMIYMLIAGSYTPTCLVTLPRRLGVPMLASVWGVAIVGTLVKWLWKSRARIVGGILYIAVGWAAIAAAPSLIRQLVPMATALFIVGGLLYTSGGITLYLRRPNPRPTLFGYHEVWHLYVIAAAGCHFVGNWLALTAA
jgi:hemolysin III